RYHLPLSLPSAKIKQGSVLSTYNNKPSKSYAPATLPWDILDFPSRWAEVWSLFWIRKGLHEQGTNGRWAYLVFRKGRFVYIRLQFLCYTRIPLILHYLLGSPSRELPVPIGWDKNNF